ncbi:MAG: ATP-dependent DNA helicase RecG [bacterium]|nr:ATP-dependent DNA helicase RecG [bacterium]
MMELSGIKGIGPTRLEALRAMGICSLRDFLYHLPVRYEDRTTPVPCSEAYEGAVLVQGVVMEPPKLSRFGGVVRVTAKLTDDSGQMSLAWYNQPWIMQQLPVAESIMLYGRVAVRQNRRVLQNAVLVREPAIVPVYKTVKGIPGKTFRDLMRRALEQIDDCCPETLPQSLRLRNRLCELNYAIRQAHFPDSLETLRIARRRIAFEQMLMYQAALGLMRNHSQQGFAMPVRQESLEAFWQKMPFPPTSAQQRVLGEVADDLRKSRAMSRLVQGDVGCGKTAIAFGAIALCCEQGYQCAMMAPTEILARQHYQSARALLEPMGISCGLLIGSMKASEKKTAHAALREGKWQAVFGTHALISEGVSYARLGLVITDEQHRFGVRQRSLLQEKGDVGTAAPHVLVMSATPIPRTLALILYGDLHVSVVDELPPGRTPVKTRVVPQEKRGGMYGFLRSQVQEGRQAYVVCPLVEDSEQLGDVRSVRTTYDELCADELNGLRVGLTWGDQPADEKTQVLDDFAAGKLDVLVSTTVIEVGVNVPNASTMVIENAERYGLSQLHQLRGRVGRGSAESWCFLVASHAATERLRILSKTNDGFVIAQKDLELRGPGEMMGTRQSGEAIAGFLLDGDVKLLEEASRCMKQLREDPALCDEREAIERMAETMYRDRMREVALN